MNLHPRYVLPVFLLIVFSVPILLGPMLYLVLEPWGIPFHRTMSRALLISALGALFLFRRRLQLTAWWPCGARAWMQVGLGVLVAAVSAQLMIAAYLAACGFSSAHLSAPAAGLKILLALVAALIVPMLEETIFRGFLVTTLVEAAGKRAGWIFAAAIYAVAHFLRVPAGAPGEPIHPWSGATGVAEIFTHLGLGEFLSGHGFICFSSASSWVVSFLRAGTLWPGAGLHGGWIFILMSFTALTRPAPAPRYAFFRGDLLGNPLTSLVLLLVGIWLWRYYHPRGIADEAGPQLPTR